MALAQSKILKTRNNNADNYKEDLLNKYFNYKNNYDKKDKRIYCQRNRSVCCGRLRRCDHVPCSSGSGILTLYRFSGIVPAAVPNGCGCRAKGHRDVPLVDLSASPPYSQWTRSECHTSFAPLLLLHVCNQ